MFLGGIPEASPVHLTAIQEFLDTTYSSVVLSEEGREVRLQEVEVFKEKMKPLATECEMEVTGSTYTGLALSTSDVNIAIFVDKDKGSMKDVTVAITKLFASDKDML